MRLSPVFVVYTVLWSLLALFTGEENISLCPCLRYRENLTATHLDVLNYDLRQDFDQLSCGPSDADRAFEVRVVPLIARPLLTES